VLFKKSKSKSKAASQKPPKKQSAKIKQLSKRVTISTSQLNNTKQYKRG
jgi:hypothetical protein